MKHYDAQADEQKGREIHFRSKEKSIQGKLEKGPSLLKEDEGVQMGINQLFFLGERFVVEVFKCPKFYFKMVRFLSGPEKGALAVSEVLKMGGSFIYLSGKARLLNLIGRKFGILEVVGKRTFAPKWICKCECGKISYKRSTDLISGKAASCGCRSHMTGKNNVSYLHGSCSTREYRSWSSMKSRCYNQNQEGFKWYGDIGIKVCEKWKDNFLAFLKDVGPCPTSHHSLDRFPNKNGNYEPGNVRWATQKEQCNNKTNNRLLEFNGELLTAPQWSEKFGVPDKVIYQRLARGWSISSAIRFPLKRK